MLLQKSPGILHGGSVGQTEAFHQTANPFWWAVPWCWGNTLRGYLVGSWGWCATPTQVCVAKGGHPDSGHLTYWYRYRCGFISVYYMSNAVYVVCELHFIICHSRGGVRGIQWIMVSDTVPHQNDVQPAAVRCNLLRFDVRFERSAAW